ncbi:MAG: shikimate kinase [Spirochaetaceae bacterium]|nr:shikimate kinase [Spirochaetaceae bacterium]
MMKIALIGFMGSGKTTIGRLLSASLGSAFLDLDDEIMRISGTSSGEIFDSLGEVGFRRMEEEALRLSSSSPGDLVLACGGGIIAGEGNRRILREDYVSIWIDVPFGEIERRLFEYPEGRPLWNPSAEPRQVQDNQALYLARLPLYEESAQLHYRWQSPEAPAESAAIISQMLKNLFPA